MEGKKGQVESGLNMSLILIIGAIVLIVLILIFKGMIDGGFK